jgi:hypothetical protein
MTSHSTLLESRWVTLIVNAAPDFASVVHSNVPLISISTSSGQSTVVISESVMNSVDAIL